VRVHCWPRLGLGSHGAFGVLGFGKGWGCSSDFHLGSWQSYTYTPLPASNSRPHNQHQSWLVVSEVQPLHMRASGTAFGTMVNFLMSFIVGQFFLTLMCNTKAYVFLFFAGEQRGR